MAIARVQAATPTQSGASATTLTISFAGTTVVGNHIVVTCGWSGTIGVTLSSVTDAAGNTYAIHTQAATGISTGCYSAIASAKCTVPLTAGQLITMTISSSQGTRLMAAAEYSGLAVSSHFDAATGATGTGTLADSGSISAAEVELLVGVCCFNTGTADTYAPTAPWNEVTEVHSTTKGLATVEQLNVSPGFYSAQGTLSSSLLWTHAIAGLVNLRTVGPTATAFEQTLLTQYPNPGSALRGMQAGATYRLRRQYLDGVTDPTAHTLAKNDPDDVSALTLAGNLAAFDAITGS